MSIRPTYRPTIIKKRTKKFIRHQSDRYDKLKVSLTCKLFINNCLNLNNKTKSSDTSLSWFHLLVFFFFLCEPTQLQVGCFNLISIIVSSI